MAGATQKTEPSSTPGFNPYENGNDEQNEKMFEIKAAVHEGNQQIPGYVSGIKLKLEDLDKILMDQRTKANEAVLMEMTLPANLVVDSTCKGKEFLQYTAVCANQDFENYAVVLTWGGDSGFDQQRCKCVLHAILSGTQWKINKINLPGAPNGAKEDGGRGNGPTGSAEGEQSASYKSDLKLKLETLDKTLKELRTEANGAVRMKMPLSAIVHDSTDESGKCPVVCAQYDVKNYEVVFTWGDDSGDLGLKQHKCAAVCAQQDVKNNKVVLTLGEVSDSGQKRRKCELHDILFGTNWMISKINLPEAIVPMESAEGEQSKSKGKKKA